MKKESAYTLAALASVLGLCILSHSCANTTQSPTGGDKDTIPPALLWTNPAPGATRVDTASGTKFHFYFDEYVTVKEAKNVFLSPPLSKSPKTKLRGKCVEVWFEEPLLENTTYSISFTGAIVDNNEGNFFPSYTYVFSTGDRIDSMFISGTVRDCATLDPVKDVTVMAYKDYSDSAIFLQRPVAACKTDEWGYFVMPYIQDTLYRIYAIKDENNDNLFQPETELIAFLDSPYRPSKKVCDTLPELREYDMKDTLECLARPSEFDLKMYREKPSRQLLKNKGRISEYESYVTFLAPDVWIDSLGIRGYKPENIITQFTDTNCDSLIIWINDRRRVPDTLNLFVNYRKTDSLGVLQPVQEDHKLFIADKPVGKKKEIKHEDTVCVYKLSAQPEYVEQKGFELEFTLPIVFEKFDSIEFKSINPKQQESIEKFTFERDPKDIRKYVIKPVKALLEGWDYSMKVPQGAFRDIRGFLSDSTVVKVTLPKDESLSTLILSIQNVSGPTTVDLMSDKKDKLFRSYNIEADAELRFPYLKEGQYSVRISSDVNGNKVIDSGSLFEHRQPESVVFYKLEDKDLIDIPQGAELKQTIDLSKLFQ